MSFDLLYMQILCFGIVLLAAYFGGRLSQFFKAGIIVGQVIGGMVAGPVFLIFIEKNLPVYREAIHSLHFFTFLFLGIIVFGIGDELSLDKLKRTGRDSIIVCCIQAFTTWVFVTGAFLLMGFSQIASYIIGSISIATAPASTFVIMNKLGITGKMRNMLGGIVVLDDVIGVLFFSVTAQIAIMLNADSEFSLDLVFYPVVMKFLWAVLVGVGVYFLLRLVIDRKWLKLEAKKHSGPVFGSDFLSRLITEMPGPSVEIFILIAGCVSLGIGFALHFHLPFLITAVTAGILISNFYSREVFESLRIENSTSLFTLLFFALIGTNAGIEWLHYENFLFIGIFIAARGGGKIIGTWFGCKVTKQEKRLTSCLPKLMLPQAGVAAIEAFYIAAVMGANGTKILNIVLPGLIIFELIGVFISEKALYLWRSWMTGGGELVDQEKVYKNIIKTPGMDFRNFLYPECLRVPLDVKSKGEAIWELIQTLHSVGFINKPGEVLDKILEREREGGTTLGEGISILHCRLPYLEKPAIVLGVLPKNHNIDFDNSHNERIDIIYLVLSPSADPKTHLQILASIAKFLSDKKIREKLRNAQGAEEALEIIKNS
ncbi:MAG: PTS sugar transporter subunit IIA [Victivallales bacterium]|nr:PTS sugar transporter subunit IIA [Victivallales bacterium]MCF7889058.1 PTS sugar transporter subunit IIA [Victivallales bacterium]